MPGARFRVSGLVQGVGFRPHVWRLAQQHGLAGTVRNDGEGVEIEAWGPAAALDRFTFALEAEAPPLARVQAVTRMPLGGVPPTGFAIAESRDGPVSTGVVADAATCSDCLAEISNPDDRRFGYAFTNCTHCGPRLSIVRAIPYDRTNTSMDRFSMCPDCLAEYTDPADRRFHAQPNACPVCGPRLWLEDRAGERQLDDPLAEAARLIAAGDIVAVKGIGGFHLACDAANGDTVDRLRQRKRRAAKPFALMARDVAQVRAYCRVTPGEAALLQDKAAPIVLLQRWGRPLAAGIAPGQARIGVMLPYSPLHHLLLKGLAAPVVMTSGNVSDEPQATGNAEARDRLAEIADVWLMHDRAIVNRLDDSVMRLDTPGPQILRRARGFAPEPVALDPGFSSAPPVLALGGELKSTFCLLERGAAVLSQHIGDLEAVPVREDYRKALALYRDLFRFDPAVIAVDMHPDYASTRLGQALAGETGAALVAIQHHHAHFASALAEHGIAPDDDRSLGVILDGLGYGPDGTVWGGELLVGGCRRFDRAGHFQPVPLPGGAAAMREPWRNLVAHLHTTFGSDWPETCAGTPIADMLADKPLGLIGRMLARGVNAPLSSSAGRLFDAVAAAVGLCADRQHYEGQAAMELEALATPHLAAAAPYPAAWAAGDPVLLSWAPLWQAILGDLRQGVEAGLIAARFHLGLTQLLAERAAVLASQRGLERIVLSGGVMQNAILADRLHADLVARGHTVLLQHAVPANDGGLALGQAAVAAASRSGPGEMI